MTELWRMCDCGLFFFFSTVVVSGGGEHYRNPTSLVSAQLPGAAEGPEASEDADRRDYNGRISESLFVCIFVSWFNLQNIFPFPYPFCLSMD